MAASKKSSMSGIREFFRLVLRDIIRGLIWPLGSLLGILWIDVLRIRRKVAVDNVALAFPEWSRAEQVRVARASLRHMGRTLFEFMLFPVLRPRDLEALFVFKGEENITKSLEAKKGVLMLSLHLGNGDLAVAALSQKGWSISLISKLFKAKWLNDFWFGLRAKHGTKFIAPERSSFEILRALKANRIVAFVLDQFMGPPVGCKTKFFGVETGTAMGLALMAERTGAPVVPSYNYRDRLGHWVIVFDEPIPWRDLGPKASRDENIAAMTQVYTDKIEEIIRQHPEQWMWIHRRWKRFA